MTPPRWNYKASARCCMQFRPCWKKRGKPAPAENIQSGAPSCLVDMLIAWSVCKHACSFTRIKHFKEELCYTPKPQSKPVMELQCAHPFGLRQWGVTVVAHINGYKSSLVAEKCITSSAKSMQEQVQDNARITPNKRKESSGKYSSPQKAGLLLSFSL